MAVSPADCRMVVFQQIIEGVCVCVYVCVCGRAGGRMVRVRVSCLCRAAFVRVRTPFGCVFTYIHPALAHTPTHKYSHEGVDQGVRVHH